MQDQNPCFLVSTGTCELPVKMCTVTWEKHAFPNWLLEVADIHQVKSTAQSVPFVIALQIATTFMQVTASNLQQLFAHWLQNTSFSLVTSGWPITAPAWLGL